MHLAVYFQVGRGRHRLHHHVRPMHRYFAENTVQCRTGYGSFNGEFKLLSKRFCRIPHRFFIMLNAHSSCTLAEENSLLKTISSRSLVPFRVRFHQPRTQRVRIVPNKVRGDFYTCHFYRIRRCGENFPLLYSAENRTSSQ